jgi:hypothetical protein
MNTPEAPTSPGTTQPAGEDISDEAIDETSADEPAE